MSWLGKLFGTDNAVEQVISTGERLLDDAFYTDAERAEDTARDRSEVRTMVVEWMANTQGQNLSRRVIALSVTGVWLLMYMLSTVLGLGAVWVGASLNARLLESIAILDERNDAMTGAVMLILGFYFAAPKIGQIADAAMARFSKQ